MELSETFVMAIFLLAGSFSLLSSILNFDWFFNSRKAATFVQWFGRTGARFFYGLLGVALITCGIFMYIDRL